MAKYKLSKPYVFEDKTVEEIEYDFESVTGEDLEVIESQLTQEQVFVAVPALHRGYCARLGALAAKVSPEFIKKLPAKDYIGFTQKVSDFLLKQD